MSEPTKHPTKAERRASTRERVEQMRREEERKRKIMVAVIASVVTVAVIAAIVGIAYAINTSKHDKAKEGAAPTNVTDNGGVVFAAQAPASSSPAQPTPAQPVLVTEYFDFICPACHQFGQTVGPELEKRRQEGKISLEYVPLGLLDQYSKGSRYSTRSAAAGYCVAEHNRDLFPAFMQTMFTNQPAESTTGLTNEQIRDYAKQAGANEQAQQCIIDQTYAGYVRRVEEQTTKKGINGTPTLAINGVIHQQPRDKPWSYFLEQIDKAVAERAGAQPAPVATSSTPATSPATTPTPSATQ